MKVTGPGNVKAGTVKSRKKAGGSADQKFEIATSEEGGATIANPVQGPLAADSLGALVSLQESPDAPGGRSKGVVQAESMLDSLEDIRHGLLLGRIPRRQLDRLAKTLADSRERTADPRLREILNDIEIRAAVELAKLDQGP